jgi:hypothetical protein
VTPRQLLLVSTLRLSAGCAGGGQLGGVSPPAPVTPPSGPTAFSFQAGIAAVACGSGLARVDFTAPASADLEVAVFVSSSRSDLFAGTPLLPAPGETHVMVSGLVDGTDYLVGLGIRAISGTPEYTRAGPVVTARPGPPVYVDVASTAVSPDGSTPATAFPTLIFGMLTAFGGGRPVWVRGGTYTEANLPLGVTVSVMGGFGPDFDLATRDPEAFPTVCAVPVLQIGMQASDPFGAGGVAVIDGVRFDGAGVGGVAVDVIDCSLELRDVQVTRMRDRGIRVRNSLPDQNFDIVLTHCESIGNGADGLSGQGAFDYFVHDCLFASNRQEGIDLDGLEPEIGGTATLELTASRFFGNSAEGLDATLPLPLVPTSGSYAIRIRGCAFERNQSSGCLIDHDFEADPTYSADILIEDTYSRANVGDGFHLDLDGAGATHLSRVLSIGNVQRGLYVTSESAQGLVTVSTSAIIGNLGEAIRAEGPIGLVGNRSIALSHCLLSGNLGGGIVSRDVTSTACSTIAYLQPSAWTGMRTTGCVTTSDPIAMGFVHAPEQYVRVTGRNAETLTLASSPLFTSAYELELANDTVSRMAVSLLSSSVVLDTAPDDFGIPGILAAFPPGLGGVQEDFRLLVGSIAEGAGMGPTGGPAVDAGIHGSPIASPPGFAEELRTPLYYPVATEPGPATALGATDPIVIRFSEDLAGASAHPGTVRVFGATGPLPFTLQSSGSELTLYPVGVWEVGSIRVELDAGIQSGKGLFLSSPIALEFHR